MPNYSNALDIGFRTLGDPTRRAIVERLSHGSLRFSDAAAPLAMALPSVHQHLAMLEKAHLVVSKKIGRERWCSLDPKGLAGPENWILNRRAVWERRLDALARHLASE